MDEDRSSETRARAETALVRLLHQLGPDSITVTVLGGLVPAVLAEAVEGAPSHIGTADVDLLLITHVNDERRLAGVERALEKMKFSTVGSDGWRWQGPVDGHRIKIEFLCDLPEHPEGSFIRPAGCSRLAASNLRGTGYVARDSEERPLSGTLLDDKQVTVRARFAGLGGYLLSKLVAVRTRAATKDYYDLVYVLIYNPEGGPTAAAERLMNGSFDDALLALRSTFLEVRERFRRTTDYGPQQYAEQAEQANPGGDLAMLRADAVSAAQEFFERLAVPGTTSP